MTNVVAIVQARAGSTRLPGKVLESLAGRPLLDHVLERLEQCDELSGILVATTQAARDDSVVHIADQRGLPWFRGSEDDVLDRYVGAARQASADVVVRITSDCPLIDPTTIDRAIEAFRGGGFDYLTAGTTTGFPRGLDSEVLTVNALYTAGSNATATDEREHVTLHVYRRPDQFRLGQLEAPPRLRHPDWRLCVDEPADLELVRAIYDRLHRHGQVIDIDDVVRLLDQEPALLEINRHVQQKQVDGA